MNRRQDGLQECRTVKVDQIVNALANADQLDRNTQSCRNSDHDAALSGAVQLGEDDAGQLGSLVELLSLMNRILTSGRIQHE